MDHALKFFASLKLMVTTLAFSIVVVFLGTIAQASEGLYNAQERFFKSWYIIGVDLFGLKVPWLLLPGGYFLGVLLLCGITAAFIKRFVLKIDKIGIHLTHIGVIVLLVGQLLTDMLSTETHLTFREGQVKNYTESHRTSELAILRDLSEGRESVVAIPEEMIRQGARLEPEKLPFTLKVVEYEPNSTIRRRGPAVDGPAPADIRGAGQSLVWKPAPQSFKMDERNIPYAIVEVFPKTGASLGRYLVTPFLDPQPITIGTDAWKIGMRFEREYLPYSVQLLKTTHEKYRGTETPKDFRSRVRIENRTSGENREVDIYMNNPLRYQGLTFFQHQMGRTELEGGVGTSTLQVVENPAWISPYFGCFVVTLGMTWQFLIHLSRFITKRLTP
jgi:hypothetical protein